MNLGHLTRLEDFGTRSLVTHAIMAVTVTGAVVTGLFVGGEIGLVSFVAFLNFTAGVWIAQSIHSLGNAPTIRTPESRRSCRIRPAKRPTGGSTPGGSPDCSR